MFDCDVLDFEEGSGCDALKVDPKEYPFDFGACGCFRDTTLTTRLFCVEVFDMEEAKDLSSLTLLEGERMSPGDLILVLVLDLGNDPGREDDL